MKLNDTDTDFVIIVNIFYDLIKQKSNFTSMNFDQVGYF